MGKFCTNCGKGHGGAKFCPECGTPTAGGDVVSPGTGNGSVCNSTLQRNDATAVVGGGGGTVLFGAGTDFAPKRATPYRVSSPAADVTNGNGSVCNSTLQRNDASAVAGGGGGKVLFGAGTDFSKKK